MNVQDPFADGDPAFARRTSLTPNSNFQPGMGGPPDIMGRLGPGGPGPYEPNKDPFGGMRKGECYFWCYSLQLYSSGMLLDFASALHLAGEQFMNPGQGPSSGMSEQYNRGPPGPIGNVQLGHRQQYGPYGAGYERRYETLAVMQSNLVHGFLKSTKDQTVIVNIVS